MSSPYFLFQTIDGNPWAFEMALTTALGLLRAREAVKAIDLVVRAQQLIWAYCDAEEAK